MTKKLIVIGFKNAGKSAIGISLASQLKLKFVDLDDEIIKAHRQKSGEKLTCREIMQCHGEEFFRNVEHEVFKGIVGSSDPMVLALGGGTPVTAANRALMKNHTIIHVAAPMGIVFERIMVNGKPAFFHKNREAFDSFRQLWKEREPVFRKLATITVINTGSIKDATKKIMAELKIKNISI